MDRPVAAPELRYRLGARRDPGALVWALASKSFRLEGFASAADTRNHIVGAILTGLGGVTALGCTIGQGISGMSTLALGSLLALVSIIAGSAATMKYLLWPLLPLHPEMAEPPPGPVGPCTPPEVPTRSR
jgi:uncharacterized membrane protein YedE/YeeE